MRNREAHPEKIQAIQHMLSPRIIRDVNRLSECMAYLGRFLEKIGEKSLLFYQILKGKVTFEWTQECQKCFDKLKEYLSQAPLLVSLIEGKTCSCIWL